MRLVQESMSTVQNGHRLFGSVKPLLLCRINPTLRPADEIHTARQIVLTRNIFDVQCSGISSVLPRKEVIPGVGLAEN